MPNSYVNYTNIMDLVSRQVLGHVPDVGTEQHDDLVQLGKMAERRTNDFMQWVTLGGDYVDDNASDGSSGADDLLYLNYIYLVAERFNEQGAGERYNNDIKRAEQRIIDNYADKVASSAYGLQGSEFTVGNVRDRVRFSLYRSMEITLGLREIDAAIMETWSEVWNYDTFNFRKRLVNVTISTDANGDGQMTFSPAGVFDSFSTRVLYYRDTGGGKLVHVGADTIAELRARYYDSTKTNSDLMSTGRPIAFRMLDSTGTTEDEPVVKQVVLVPTPDTTYYAYGEIIISPPTLNVSDENAIFAGLPKDFRPAFIDLVRGRAVMNRTGDSKLWREAWKIFEDKAKDHDDRGNVDADTFVRDVYNDLDSTTSSLYDDYGIWGF